MYSEFFVGGDWAPNILGHTKFEDKKYSNPFNLQSTVDSEFLTGGIWALTFLVMLNLRSKFFGIF